MRSVLGYVSIFDDEQRSHWTKDGVLHEAQEIIYEQTSTDRFV